MAMIFMNGVSALGKLQWSMHAYLHLHTHACTHPYTNTFIYRCNFLQKKKKLFKYVHVFVKCDFVFLHGIFVFCGCLTNYPKLGGLPQ